MMGTKRALVIMKIRYAFHSRRLMMMGVIMTMVKFQSQLLEIPMAVPRVRASRGRISGTMTQGYTFSGSVSSR